MHFSAVSCQIARAVLLTSSAKLGQLYGETGSNLGHVSECEASGLPRKYTLVEWILPTQNQPVDAICTHHCMISKLWQTVTTVLRIWRNNPPVKSELVSLAVFPARVELRPHVTSFLYLLHMRASGVGNAACLFNRLKMIKNSREKWRNV